MAPRGGARSRRAPWETGIGTVENGLPYDGCSWVIDIGGTKFPERAKRGRGMASEYRGLRGPEEYVPDAASLPEVQSAVADAAGVTPIALTYRPTGETGKAECGFGSEPSLPEIEISSVMKR